MTGRVMVSGRWVPIEEILGREYKRDPDGQFASGGGSDDDLGEEPVGPALAASTSAGGYQIAAFVDHDGTYGPEGGRIVSIDVTGGRPNWAKDGPDEGTVLTANETRQIADGMTDVAKTAASAPTPTDPHAFDEGPALLATTTAGTHRVSAFHDGNGDLGEEGGRFVQVRDIDAADWQDSLSSGGRILDVDLKDAPGLAEGLRAMAGDT